MSAEDDDGADDDAGHSDADADDDADLLVSQPFVGQGLHCTHTHTHTR